MLRSKITLLCLGLGFLTVACESELDEMKMEATSASQIVSTAPVLDQAIPEILSIKRPAGFDPLQENLRNALVNEAVAASECSPTDFAAIQKTYLEPLVNDLYKILGPKQYASIFYLYMDLNFYYAYLDRSAQYFGESGEFTDLVVKRQRELEGFWQMPNQIQVNGQHTATLNDREKLADLYEVVGANITTRAEAYNAADQILSLNTLSPYLPESPFFAIDGFATTNKLIVIGDGLVKTVSEAGIASDIVWTGVLSHEWAHQVQFKNYSQWYPNGAAADPSESTRYTELEADFLAAYYMTHKRGATYNWKRVQQFYELFFQIGDCSFSSPGHHGTPAQRMAAARLGYELANAAQKQGQILTQQEAHAYFVNNMKTLL